MPKKEITIDELASMVQTGFTELRDEIKGDINGLKGDISGLKGDISSLKEDIEKLQNGQTRIEMRLMNVVYRSEFEKLKDEVAMIKKAIKMN